MATQLAAKVQDSPRYAVHGGVQNEPNEKWVPFEWIEPRFGAQVHGEYVVIRPEGTSGSLSAGFWRTGPSAPGAAADGSHTIVYSSPLGDETACVIDGTAVLTVIATGKSYKVGPGSIIYSPKGLEVQWEIEGPSFKKWWCIWNGSEPTANPPQDLLIMHTSENPDEWQEYHFVEPAEGAQVAGELYFNRSAGSTGTMLSGVWRSGKGIAGTNVDEKGTLVTPYTGVLGDETILLLEGEVEVVETDTGKVHNFKAGDSIGLSSGMHITWTSKGPFSKKLWVITRDVLPE
ncbi:MULTISPECIES: cupin domain-containing protein [unclassified Novosphingobium]|uniref:cupin domain-containing protein n=1 Tax=unclassified Novosphingobium TaxID=2644732 RepID=UPI001447FBAF|nr:MULTISPECIES: cupin domain-containing protein [unclassified Novosphingobium]NKJ45050.1 putative cupin superfamily protein [Novosphingobium sp. SG720]NMN06426.1 putative cupin superfamily protein [Novosphingobium sp. SG919]NMN89127.1 putative cupin superfamily protein [Novosphingobium sp. SG916]